MNRRIFLKIAGLFGVTGFLGLEENAVAAPSTKVLALSKLPIGGSFEFTSKTGVPAMVFRTKKGVYAYSLKCTHLGCKVELSNNVLVCPCHNSQFDPVNNGKVLAGPASQPLPKIRVAISGKNVVEI